MLMQLKCGVMIEEETMQMKKWPSLLLATVLSISLVACGTKTTGETTTSSGDANITVSANDTYHKGDSAQGKGFSLTVDSVDATPEFLNYEDADSGYEYFFVSFELENTSSEPLETNNFFTIYADETECKNISFLESYDGAKEFDIYSDLPAGRKVKSYISAIVPEKWNTIEFACADGTTFSFAHTDLGVMSAQENSSEELVLHTGDTMTRNGMQITLKSVIQTDYIPYLSTMYYEPEVGNHFLVLFFDITNTTSSAQQFSIVTSYDAYIDDYSGQFTGLHADINGESDLGDYDYTDILSGKSISGYKTIEVPDGWKKVELASRQGTFEITPETVTVQ